MRTQFTKQYWLDKLEMQKHPEGGYYKETFRSKNQVKPSGKMGKPYNIATAIYFLLGSYAEKDFSAWHRMDQLEETWCYHYGADLLIHWIDKNSRLITKRLGLGPNACLQITIPANTWFAAIVIANNPDAYSLISCMVYPGFEFSDFELGKRSELIAEYPQHKDIIEKLTRI
jgi:uncharacterized protein